MQEQKTIYIDQTQYILSKLKKYGFDKCSSESVPADPNSVIDLSVHMIEGSEVDTKFPYAEVSRSLQFAQLCTRFDISYAVAHAAKFMSRPTILHVTAVKCILKYLQGTSSMRITYSGGSSNHLLEGFCDADYAMDLDDRKSRSGFILTLNGGPISWGSRKQGCTTGSTTESKYVAAHLATQEIIWARRLLADLDYDQTNPTQLWSDNQASVRLVQNPEFHCQTKHIDVKYHIICKGYTTGQITVSYINTNDQVADLLTKPLLHDRFERLQSLLGMNCTVDV